MLRHALTARQGTRSCVARSGLITRAGGLDAGDIGIHQRVARSARHSRLGGRGERVIVVRSRPASRFFVGEKTIS